MKLFYSAPERDALERAHADGPPGAVAPTLALAWSLRQLDPTRALALLAPHQDAAEVRPWWLLIRAEHVTLQPDLAAAGELLSQAQALFIAQAQGVGLRLSRFIQAQLVVDQGDYHAAMACLAALSAEVEAVVQANGQAAEEAELALVARFTHNQLLVICDLEQARLRIESDPPPGPESPTAQAVRAISLCSYYTQLGQFSQAIVWGSQAHQLYTETGHMRRAISTCCLLAYCFNSLGDHGGALDWIERGLKEADPRAWNGLRLACLTQMGGILTRQQQLSAAQAVFEQAMPLMAVDAMDRNSTLLRSGMAEVLLKQGQPEAALPLFAKVLEAGQRAGQADLVIEAICGEAQARFELGQQAQALSMAEAALHRAQQEHYATGELALRRLLARMLMQASPPDAARAKAMLQPAFELCETPLDLAYSLWQEMGQIEAELGHPDLAYDCATKALASCIAQQQAESQQRSLAMQAQFQVQQVRHENEQLRQRHADEQARYELLEENHQTLDTITDIGRALTALRDVPSLFQALHAQLGRLLGFDTLLLMALDDRAERLDMVAGVENGGPIAPFSYALGDPTSLSARCAREKQLIVVRGGVSSPPLPGTRSMASMLFAPLLMGDRVTGVLSVQTLPAEAFGEREQQLLQMLATYLAIAIDNVMAYQRVARLQAELSERQRLAALGSLVAGMAHELSTPIGNAVLAVGSLREAGLTLDIQLQASAVRRKVLTETTQCIRDGADMAERNLHRASALIDIFKGLTDTSTLLPRQRISLQALVPQACAPLRQLMSEAHVELHLDLDMAPPVLAEPQTLIDVIQAITFNVIDHAQARQLQWRAEQRGQEGLHLICQDDGIGMDEAVSKRVFEPFFSTRFGQGSNGLGLALVMHKVRVLLGGDIGVESQPGRGSQFWIRLDCPSAPNTSTR